MATQSDADPLNPVSVVLRRAFPSSVPDVFYVPLLKVLIEEMSFRSVARALELTWGCDYSRGLHDAYGAESQADVNSQDVEAVRRMLGDAGYGDLDE